MFINLATAHVEKVFVHLIKVRVRGPTIYTRPRPATQSQGKHLEFR